MDIIQLQKQIYRITSIPICRQRLIFNGKLLNEGHTLATYNIQNEDVIYLYKEQHGGMYHLTSGRQDFDTLTYYAADAIRNVMSFNLEDMKYAHHLSSIKLQEFILQARVVLANLYRKIEEHYLYKDISDLKNMILPTYNDDEDSSGNDDDDMSSDE
jgi:hypothetical protein